MANQLRQQIEQISREKNINPEVIIAAIEDAILTASKKYYKNNEDLRSRFNNETGADRGLRGPPDRGDGGDPRDPDRPGRGAEAHPRGRGRARRSSSPSPPTSWAASPPRPRSR